VVAVSVLSCLLLAVPVATAPLDLSFMAVFDNDIPELARYAKLAERLEMNSRLLLLLEGEDEDALDDARDRVVAALRSRDDVRYVISEPPAEWAASNLPWLLEDSAFDDLMSSVTDPADRDASKRLSNSLQAMNKASPLERPGARLVLVGLMKNPLDIDIRDVMAGLSPFEVVEAATGELLVDQPVTWSYAGFAAIAAQDQKATLVAVSKLTPLSLLLVLLLLRFVEPRPARLFAIALPMLLSLVAALGITTLLLGSITFIEAFFGMMVFGLGVDFGLHLTVRLREERAAGHKFEDALKRAITGCGPAIIAGAMTTTGAFAVISTASDPVPRHMGVSGAAGLAICLILMLTLLPATWVLLERRGTVPKPEVLPIPFLPKLARNAALHPKAWLIGALVLSLAATAGVPNYRFETDLSKIFNRDTPAVLVGDKIQSLFDANMTAWVVATPTLAEARQVQEKFESAPEFGRVEGAAKLFPGDLEARSARLREALPAIAQRKQSFAALAARGPGLLGAAARGPLTMLSNLEAAAERGPPTGDSLPIEIREGVMGSDGSWLTFAYGLGSTLQAMQLRKERLAAEAIHPTAAGLGNFVELATSGDRPWIKPTLLGVLALVLLVLVVDLRDPRWVLLGVTPVVMGTLITFGIMCWMDIGFSVLLILVIPLLLGLGVDDGLHVVHRMREDESLTADEATVSVGRAIVMTTVTTSASFGALMISNHPGMESIAITMLLGLTLCLLASTTLVPALAVVLGLRKPPQP